MNPAQFSPQGNTVLVAASSSTAGTPTQIDALGCGTCWLSNPSTISVYLAFGSSTVQAAVPTTAAPSVGMNLPAGQSHAFRKPDNPSQSWLSAVTSAGSAAPGVFATPGSGQ